MLFWNPQQLSSDQHRHTLYTNLLINVLKLPRPEDVVQKLSMIEAIVVRTVRLSMVSRRQHGHLVTIHCVTVKEMLHFFSHLHHNSTATVTLPLLSPYNSSESHRCVLDTDLAICCTVGLFQIEMIIKNKTVSCATSITTTRKSKNVQYV